MVVNNSPYRSRMTSNTRPRSRHPTATCRAPSRSAPSTTANSSPKASTFRTSSHMAYLRSMAPSGKISSRRCESTMAMSRVVGSHKNALRGASKRRLLTRVARNGSATSGGALSRFFACFRRALMTSIADWTFRISRRSVSISACTARDCVVSSWSSRTQTADEAAPAHASDISSSPSSSSWSSSLVGVIVRVNEWYARMRVLANGTPSPPMRMRIVQSQFIFGPLGTRRAKCRLARVPTNTRAHTQ
mmetsp:Transcript_6562/g.23839  ORF Transcript_6562/g.23839 Transcript_6562/m.23839 type:complete len:247 (+) Transcript_6562:2111-2851(+)